MTQRTDLHALDGLGCADLVARGDISAAELVEAVSARIRRLNPLLNCCVLLDEDGARRRAAAPQEGPFRGLPWLLKDLTLKAKGLPTTGGFPFLLDRIATYDSVMVQRARAAGLNLIGKTTTPQAGSGPATESRLWGPTASPWRLELGAGGSSGGAGAAVAARIVPLAHASDGGGSIRIPASLNGLVGLKPSRGRTTYAPDRADYWLGIAQEGCVSVTVRDTAAYADALFGPVAGEPYAVPGGERLLNALVIPMRGIRIGVLEGSALDADPECKAAVAEAAALCASLGHHVESVSHRTRVADFVEPLLTMIAVENHLELLRLERELGRRLRPDEFEPAILEAMLAGGGITGAEFAFSVENVRRAGVAIASEMDRFDLILGPTMPHAQRPHGTFDTARTDTYSELVLRSAEYTLPASISGQPAISLPLHWTPDGLPVGVQFTARIFDEPLRLKLAAQLEEARPWRDRVPPVWAGAADHELAASAAALPSRAPKGGVPPP